MKKSLVALACLLILALQLSTFPAQTAQGARGSSPAGRPALDGENWYDSHWLYRRAVSLSNPCGQAVSDYQVQITLDASFDFSKANANASDVRITESDGVTPVPFWIETWDSTGRQASIWIKAPIIPLAGATVYLYYGNPEPIEDPAPVETPPVGPWTRAAGNPIVPIGDPGSGANLLAENIVYDDATEHYWMVFANYRTNPSTVGLVWSDDPGNVGSWNWFTGNTMVSAANAPHIVKDGSTWYIFYSDWTGDYNSQHSIMVRSSSSITGPYTNPITVLSPSAAWEAWRVDEPYVFKRNDNKWVLMYMADSGGAHEQVSFAIADAITGPYTKFGTTPAIPWGPAGSYDAGTVADPWVVEFNGTYYIGYTVSPTIYSPWQTAYATTTDWQTFTKRGLTLPLGPAGAWDAPNSFRGAVTRFEDTYYFPYTGDAYRMGMATQPARRSPAASIGAQYVFPFFDDFNDDSFDTTKWTIAYGTSGQVSESGGYLTLTANSPTFSKINGRISFGMNYVVETYGRHPQAGVTNLIAETGMSDSAVGLGTSVRIVDDFPDTTHWQRMSSVGTTETKASLATVLDTGWHTLRTYRLAPNVAGYQIDGNQAETNTASTPTGNLYPFLMSYADGGTNQLIVDWIRVRQYCGANAIATVGSEELFQSLGRIDISMTGPSTAVAAGSTVQFTITVNNTGGADLHNVAVADNMAPDCARTIGNLAAGANTIYTCTLANVSEDFTNSATATGLTPTETQVSDTSILPVDVIHPALAMSMTPESQTIYKGAPADFQISVSNTGDVDLTGVSVDDVYTPCQRTIGTLAAGANHTYTCRLLNILGDFDHTAVAVGTPPVGPAVTASDSSSVTITPLTTGSWFDTAWSYRQPIIITPPAPAGQPAQAVTEFQVRVLLSSSFGFANALADGSDLRVTASDGTTLIPFWIESWNPGGNTASLWVRVPSIPLTDTLIHIYYGNPAPGSPASDPAPQPPTGPFTKLPGNPITVSGCPNQILPENIVVDGDKLWLIVANRCTSPNSLALLSHPLNDTNLTANWTFEKTVLSGSIIGDADRQLDSPHIVQSGANWYLFYSTFKFRSSECGCYWNESYPATIGIAKSENGIDGNYMELNSAILTTSATGGWDDARVAEPYVIQRANGDWVMVYMGDADPSPGRPGAPGYDEQVGIAISTSGIEGPYVRDDPEPEIAFGPSGSLDAGTIADPWVVLFNNTYYVGYTASPTKAGWNTTFATTTDWATFTKSNRVILGQGPGTWDSTSSFRGAVTLVGDQYLFPYTGQGSPGFQFGMATQPYQTVPLSIVNNPDAVFEFYDTFDGTQVDTTKWSISETGTGTGSAAVSSGKLNLSAAASGSSLKLIQMVGNTSFGPGMLLEGLGSHPVADGTGHTAAELGFSDAGRSNMLRILDYNNPYFLKNTAANGVGGNNYIPMAGALYTGELMHRIYWAGSADVRFSFGEDTEERVTSNIPTINIPPWLMVYSDSSPYQGSLEMDWIRVRKWVGAAAIPIAGAVQGCDRSATWVDDGYTPGGYNGGHTWGCTGFASIQSGIEKVADGGTVNVAAGTYAESINLNKAATVAASGDIAINGSLTIQAGTFNAPPGSMSLTGDFTLSGGTFNPGSGTVTFNGTGVQNLNASAITFQNLGTGLNATLATTGEVILSGALSNLGVTRETKTVSGAPSLHFNLANITIDITTQGSLSQLQVDRRDQSHEFATQGIQTGKYWLITPNVGASGFMANLTLPHYDTPDTMDKVCRYTGTAKVWDCAASSYNAVDKTITRNGIAQFSPWATGNNVGPTAVELIDLTARPAPAAAPGGTRLLLILLGLSVLALGASRRTQRGRV